MGAYPSYLVPVDGLVQSMEVVGQVTEKTQQDGSPKTRDGVPGWVVPVDYIRESRSRTLRDGTTETLRKTDTINVTVWAKKKPSTHVGDFVHFEGLGFGAFQGSLFYQAFGLTVDDEVVDQVLGDYSDSTDALD